MPSSSLQVPYRQFRKETTSISDGFHRCMQELTLARAEGTRDFLPLRLSGEMAVLRLHDAWARFCREVVFMSASCRPYTLTGNRLPFAPDITCRRDVMSKLMTVRRVEPKWYDAMECVTASRQLRISNVSNVSAALIASNSPADEIRVIRNFFAHRGNETASKIRNLSFYRFGKLLTVEELVGETLVSDLYRFDIWVIELANVAEAAIR